LDKVAIVNPDDLEKEALAAAAEARSLAALSEVEEVEPGDRAPILRRYLEVAPGARPHVPVDRHAPLVEFERIAGQFPVFQIIPAA